MRNALLQRAEQFTFELGAQNTIVNSTHAQAAQYSVDGGRHKLKSLLYLEKEGVLALIACLASVKIQQVTRKAYFGSDG